MSHQLISHNAHLKRLRDEGYDIFIQDGHLIMRDVSYVDVKQQPRRGVLVVPLNPTGDDPVGVPIDHTILFSGDAPCDKSGKEIIKIIASLETREVVPGLTVQRRFSAKPIMQEGQKYPNFYEHMVWYAAILSGPAESINPEFTPRTFPVLVPDEEDGSVFNYADSASSRAGIVAISKKLELTRVAIVGLGGSGSYVLDLIAKTPIREIHLYDADIFHPHNAFRSPGAASIDDLKEKMSKVDYLHRQYSKMRKNIFPHEVYLSSENIDELLSMDFVFLCLDSGEAKKLATTHLRNAGIPFVECGMGLYVVDESIAGQVRLTTSSADKSDHLETYIPFSDGNMPNEYAQNIQVADLNALNAALAVIRWKKLFGFYNDRESEHQCDYALDGNKLMNNEQL